MQKIYYPYSEFQQDLHKLTSLINQTFDTIVPIARGGLSMGQMLGEYYNIRKVLTLNTIGYNNTEKLEETELFNIPNLSNSQKVLIVDDIVDSGETLIKVLNALELEYPNIIFYTASIFYKPTASIEPTWWIKEPKGWIEFFWSEDLKT